MIRCLVIILAAGAATSCGTSLTNFSEEVRCAAQEHVYAAAVDQIAIRALHVTKSYMWLKKASGIAPEGKGSVDVNRAEMLKAKRIMEPHETHLTCRLSNKEEHIASQIYLKLFAANAYEENMARGEGERSADEMLDMLVASDSRPPKSSPHTRP